MRDARCAIRYARRVHTGRRAGGLDERVAALGQSAVGDHVAVAAAVIIMDRVSSGEGAQRKQKGVAGVVAGVGADVVWAVECRSGGAMARHGTRPQAQ